MSYSNESNSSVRDDKLHVASEQLLKPTMPAVPPHGIPRIAFGASGIIIIITSLVPDHVKLGKTIYATETHTESVLNFKFYCKVLQDLPRYSHISYSSVIHPYSRYYT